MRFNSDPAGGKNSGKLEVESKGKERGGVKRAFHDKERGGVKCNSEKIGFSS